MRPKLPPGPRSWVPGRTTMALSGDPLGFFTDLARYGDVAAFRIVGQPIALLSHPDHVEDVLVTHARSFMKGRALQRAKRLLGEGLLTSEGDLHRRQRRLVQPAFHMQRIQAYAGTMVEQAGRLSERWAHRSDPAQPLDVAAEMMRLTMAIVGRTLFDADLEAEAGDVGEALNTAMELFESDAWSPWLELLEWLPSLRKRRFMAARTRLDATIYRLIEQRRGHAEDRGDLLSMLMMAQDQEGDGGAMSDTQLRDELLTLFLAGHETTANALTWTWYLLSENPAAEACLHAELNEVLGERAPAMADLPRLRYTEMVLSESMRLFPPAWIVGRRSLEDRWVGGYVLPRGTIVAVSQWVIHRDPRFFPDPLRFDPERWTPEARAARPKYSYFPFGGGPRRCIGEQFAWTEGILVLAALAQRWRLRLVPGHPVVPRPSVTLRPRHGMRMTVSPRSARAPVPADS